MSTALFRSGPDRRPTARAVAFRPARVRLSLAILLPAALLLGACTADAEPDQTASPNAMLETALQEARSGGEASDRQLQILEDAVDSGAVPFEAYEEAVNATLSCLDEGGVQYLGPDIDDSLGFPRIQYAIQAGYSGRGVITTAEEGNDDEVTMTPGQATPDSTTEIDPQGVVADSCLYTHSAFVEAAYGDQELSTELYDANLEAKRDSVLACAESAGIALDEDLPIRELLSQLLDNGEQGRRCLAENEISQF